MASERPIELIAVPYDSGHRGLRMGGGPQQFGVDAEGREPRRQRAERDDARTVGGRLEVVALEVLERPVGLVVLVAGDVHLAERGDGVIDRLAALPPETVVYPGHGPSTTIGVERATNPFLNGSMRLVRG